MPPRRSPGSLGYAVIAPNFSAPNHGKKRVAISYIYLLILRELASR
jgi:hypothetical protein